MVQRALDCALVLRAFELDPIGTLTIEETSVAHLLRLSDRTYWRRIWPASLGLARYLLERFGTDGLLDRQVLDLGCGVGLAGIVCRRLGADVTFLDREPGALAAVRRNCRRNGLTPAQTIGGDWNHGGRRLAPAAYDVVVGVDVVYDDAQWPSISTALLRTLRPGGVAFLADPGWVNHAKLGSAFRRSGFSVSRARRPVAWPPWHSRQRSKTIDIYTLKRRDSTTSPRP